MVKQSRTGVWFVGVRGSVATTAMAGAAAVRLGLTALVGLVSELPDFAQLPLPDFGELVFGGHDVVATPLAKRVEQLTSSGVVPANIASAVLPEVTAVEAEIRDGVHVEDAVPQLQVVERLAADIVDFRERHGLDRVVVINVSSTEPPSAYRPEHDDLAALTTAMRTDAYVLPPSSVSRATRPSRCRLRLRRLHPVDGSAPARASTSWRSRAASRTRAATARPVRRSCGRRSRRCSPRGRCASCRGRAPTCWAAATAPPWPTRPPRPARPPQAAGHGEDARVLRRGRRPH